DPRVHRSGTPGGGRRAATLPAVRPAAQPHRPHLPPPQRLPSAAGSGVTTPGTAPPPRRPVPAHPPVATPVPTAGGDGLMPSPDLVEALDLLTHGELTIEGRLVDASNLTLRCRV